MHRILLSLLLLIAVPAASMTTPVSDVRLASTTEFDLESAAEFDPRPPFTGDVSDCRSLGTVVAKPQFKTIQFREEAWQGGCGEMRATILIPAGASRLTLRFEATRDIQKSLQASPTTNDLYQSVRIYDSNLTQITGDWEYFKADESAILEPTPKEHLVSIPAGATRLTVGWFFFDANPSPNQAPAAGISPGVGQSFGSTIYNPRVAFDNRPLPTSELRATGNVTRGDDMIERQEFLVKLTQSDLLAAHNELLISILATHDVAYFATADGMSLPLEQITEFTTGGVSILTVPNEALRSAGTYRLGLEHATPLPPSPPPPAKAMNVWLVYTPLTFAFLSLVSATSHHEYFRRAALPEQRPIIARNITQLVVLAIIFGGLTWYVLTDAFMEMAEVPTSRHGIYLFTAYSVLAGLAIFHVAMGSIRRQYAIKLRHTQEIEVANDILARSNRDLERFAYVASHDLQEPLRQVVSFTNLLSSKYPDKLDARGLGYVSSANDSALRARQLISDLLAFSRIGQDEPTSPVDLQDLMAAVKADLNEKISDTRTKVTVGKLPTITGSPALLHQLFFNLINNALHYRKPGRVAKINVSSKPGPGVIVISVSDNGLGIPAEDHGKVFQLFQRFHARSSEHPGSSMGLAICQRIVEFHRGRIWLESTVGIGTTFYVALPWRK